MGPWVAPFFYACPFLKEKLNRKGRKEIARDAKMGCRRGSHSLARPYIELLERTFCPFAVHVAQRIISGI